MDSSIGQAAHDQAIAFKNAVCFHVEIVGYELISSFRLVSVLLLSQRWMVTQRVVVLWVRTC